MITPLLLVTCAAFAEPPDAIAAGTSGSFLASDAALPLAGPASGGSLTPPPLPVHAEQADAEQLRQEMEALRREVEELRAHASRSAMDEVRAAERRGASRTGFGESVRVEEGEEVDEIVSFGDDVEIAGHVLGDAVSFGGNVVVHRTGLVDGDAVSFGGRVVVEDGGAIDGDRVAMSMPPTPLTGERPAPVTPIEPSAPMGVGSLTQTTSASEVLHALYRKLVWLMSVAGAGVLVVGVFPQRVSRVASDLESRPVRAAVVGSLATAFLLLFSLLFTLVTLGLGLPVGLLLVGLLGLAWLFGFVGLCQAVGDRLPFKDRPHGRWLAFLVGVLLVTFLSSLPWVGWLVVGSASVLGIGSALSTRFGKA